MQEDGAAVAVRDDPDDPQNVELDLGTEVPPAPVILASDDGTRQTLTSSKSTFTAAEILQHASPCTVDVLGGPATGVVLMVHRDDVPDYQAQIGAHIPDAAVAKVIVGATLPARGCRGRGCRPT
jgi:hypothetical protein